MRSVRAYILLALMFWGSTQVQAQFSFVVDGNTVVNTGSGIINTTYNFGPGNAITVTVLATSISSGNGYTMDINNISFQNGTATSQTVTIALTATNAVNQFPAGNVTSGIFNGISSLNSSSLSGSPGHVTNTSTIQGTVGALLSRTLFDQDFIFSTAGGNVVGSFTTPYTGTNFYTINDTLVVTVPAASGFTYSAQLTFAVPEPTTIGLLVLTGVTGMGAAYRTVRRRKQVLDAEVVA